MLKTPEIMIVAGEASGDTLGAELVRALRASVEESPFDFLPRFFGAGGPRMAAAGVELEIDLTEHAVVGLVEVLKRYPLFKGFFDRLLALACKRQPDVIVLIDYPGFNLRFARALRERLADRSGPFNDWHPRLIYYVSPQVWAWNERRVYAMARDLDLMLVIFPFEPAWYAARVPQFPVRFVGHPLVDRFERPPWGDPPGHPSMLLLPGSRVRELKRHLPVLREAVRRLRTKGFERFRCIVPSESLAARARAVVGAEAEVQVGGLEEALRSATVAIAASGTVTLECAWFGVPTVVIYRTSWSTYWLGRQFIRVPHLAMPNLLAGKPLFPELIQQAATGSRLAAEVESLARDGARRSEIREGLARVIESLGAGGGSRRAAREVLREAALAQRNRLEASQALPTASP